MNTQHHKDYVMKTMKHYLDCQDKTLNKYRINLKIWSRKMKGWRPYNGKQLSKEDLKNAEKDFRALLKFWDTEEMGWTIKEVPDIIVFRLQFDRVNQ